ncbi:hypothetical protein NT6N_03990 [Oceaniferula spumae]|uniref:DUF1579 domain-containing protein n=1 Tax=Oceaniferula spumae TaxID=2979115 RepID=A0AAT9FHH2_9BACT
MKILLVTIFLYGLVSSASADAGLKNKFVGIWWGTMKITNGYELGYNEHWIIERKNNGQYRRQRFMVDHVKRMYCPFSLKPVKGLWRLSDSSNKFIYLIYKSDIEGGANYLVTVNDGVVRWTGGNISGPEVDWSCEEVKIKKFAPKFNGVYQRVTRDEFDKRNR